MIQSAAIREESVQRLEAASMGRADRHPRTAPLPFAAMVLCVIAGFLALDHCATPDEQLLLGEARRGLPDGRLPRDPRNVDWAWHWAVTTPGARLISGYPPSGIASVYVQLR